MEPIKNFKISTKRKDANNLKVQQPAMRPIYSKTPMKLNKTQTKSQTPNKNFRKLVSVKPFINQRSFQNLDSNILTGHAILENPAFLPKIITTPLQEGCKLKTEMAEEDKMIVNSKPINQKIDVNKQGDGNKQMICMYFRHRIRSLLYSIQRREIAKNIKVELGNLMTALSIRKKVKI